MALAQLFDENLVFCLHAENQEDLFHQVADLLEEREVVTSSYRNALLEREKAFPTGLDMEFLGKDLPNVAIPHTDIAHNLTENVVVVKLDLPVTFHNINNSSSSQTNILAQLMDFFTSEGNLAGLASLNSKEELFQYISKVIK